MSDFKPKGFSTVSPYLVSHNPAASIEFMEKVLGAELIDKQVDQTTSRIIHASLSIQDSVIMIGGAMEGWPERPAHVHVYVREVDQSFADAIAAGATPVQDPVKQPGDDDKRGGVLDAGGTTWWLSTHSG
nr:VOC family protein [Hyphomonas sp. Mor2]